MTTRILGGIALAGAAASLATVAVGAHLASADEPTAEEFFDGFYGTADAGWSTRDGYALAFPGDVDDHARFIQQPDHFTIAIPGGTEHNQWWLHHAEIRRPYTGSGFYEVKVDSDFTGYQQVGLTFESSPGTFMQFMLYSNQVVHAYVERFANVGGEQHKETVVGYNTGRTVSRPAPGPWYLRVVVDDDDAPQNRTWHFQWSDDGSDWITVADGVLETADPEENAGEIRHVGVFAGNQHSGYTAFDARIDYFYSGPVSGGDVDPPPDDPPPDDPPPDPPPGSDPADRIPVRGLKVAVRMPSR